MTWSNILDQVATFRKRVFERKRAEPFFRGHANHTWALQPSLFRSRGLTDPRQVVINEGRLYWRVVRLGAHLLPDMKSSWETLFIMQHHGMPTRLLDWTESFGTALWFALSESTGSEPCVWMLDQYRLNELESGHDALYLPDYDFTPAMGRYASGYEPYVVNTTSRSFADFPHRIASIAGLSSIPRVRSQRGVFTLHRDPTFAAESDPDLACCFQKITIPMALIPDALAYLAVAGINSFTIFPDLFGLNLYLRRTVLGAGSDDLL